MDDRETETATRAPEPERAVSLDEVPLHSANLLTVLDEDGVVRYESPSIERLFGYGQDELVGRQVADYFHPEDRDAVLDAFAAVVDGDGDVVESAEYRHERVDGTYCWVESVTSTDTTPAGNYVVNTRDISDRKARERELLRANERLEEFAQVVAHDLRNPLQVARARLALAAEHRDDEHLAAIDRCHDRMETLTETLLELARNGERSVDVGAVDLRTVVAECWANVETADATRTISVDRTAYADESLLKQLFENLVGNAVQHGGADVSVAVGPLADGFYVEDDGPGMPDGVRERAYDPGYSTAEDGTGFGLGIVEQVVEAHGWTVEIVDGVDGGTRFEVTGVVFDE